MVRRLLAPMLLLPLAALIYAAPAWADDAVVVLDRGRAAKADARRYERDALHLVEALRARGIETRLTLYGTRPDGRIRASWLAGDLEDRLARAAAKEGWRYEAPTDPRHALEVSLRAYEGTGPLLVFLVGPFAASAPRVAGAVEGDAEAEEGEDEAPEGGDEEPEGEEHDADPGQAAAAEALATWQAKAPASTRVFAPDLSAAGLARITGAHGVVVAGLVVLAAGDAVAHPAPWSPLATGGPQAALEATLRVPLAVRTVGAGARGPVLRAVSSDGLGEIRIREPDEGRESAPEASARETTITFTVERAAAAGETLARVETVSFEATEDAAVLWLTDPPGPRTIQWTTLCPDARAQWLAATAGVEPTPVDGARPLDADQLLVGRPLVRICRIEHTRVGETPEWQVSPAGADGSGGLPAELSVSLGETVNLTDEIAYRDLEVRLEARAGMPGSNDGVLVLEAAGHPARFEVPYHLVVPPGRVVALLDAPGEALRLPAAEDAPAWTLVVEEERPGAPPLVRVEAVLDPPSLALALTARLVGGGSVDMVWDLSRPLELRPGRRYDLHVDLAPGVRVAAGTLALRLPEQRGVEGRAQGRGRFEARSPRLVVPGDAWAYAMQRGEVVGDPPLVLEVDADGGGGDWRLALYEATPAVTVGPDAPIAFTVQPEGPGRWALVPRGDWRGARGNTFSARDETVPVRVTWAPGRTPVEIAVRVRVRPRWGAAGWILAGLAALALALGLWSLLQMKAAPVEGTLLYQVEGRQGAVGRLDLADAGRRRTEVRADAAGRLSLSRAGPADAQPVAIIRPTRVGALLELPAATPPERHILVDGLTVTAGRHRIRYVSARPGDATVPAVPGPEEDLLGPEYDMPSGRIDALRREEPEPPPAS